jgi:hypothetical protein
MASIYTRHSTAWLKRHDDGIVAGADSLVLEARAIVMWDAYFIAAKLRRALDGRVDALEDEIRVWWD